MLTSHNSFESDEPHCALPVYDQEEEVTGKPAKRGKKKLALEGRGGVNTREFLS